MRPLALVVIAACLWSAGSALSAVPTGEVAYSLRDGQVFVLRATPGAKPQSISADLDRLSKGGADGWLNISPDGRFLLLSTERFGCGGWACLALVNRDVSAGGAIRTPAGVIHDGGFGAVASGGGLVVYPAEGGPHRLDLWSVRKHGAHWGAPELLTSGSPRQYNSQPAISADGTRVLFDCGSVPYSEAPTEICETPAAGGPVRVVVPGGPSDALHHAAFAPDGSVVFEGDWQGEQIWKLPRTASRPIKVSTVHDDNSPCVLPDGRIVSLWLDRPGNPRGYHEIKAMSPSGTDSQMLLTGIDVQDVGIGCGA